MLVKKILVTMEMLVLVSIFGCTDKAPSVTEQQEHVTNAAAQEVVANNYVEIEYAPGSILLTDSAKSSLSSILKEARQDGKINEVIVLSWADKEYPSKDLKELPQVQRELAEKRNKNVEQYVKSMRDVAVNTYNMAERPTAFSKLFNTADSKLKETMVAAGLSTTANSDQFVNKSSHSVILVKLK
jgi:hypothetical protein